MKKIQPAPRPARAAAPAQIERMEDRYKLLLSELSRIGPISHGSVMHQPPGAWRWTRKVKARTVSVALSGDQAALMQQAIANQRRMDLIVDEMRELTQKLIMTTVQGVTRRTRKRNPKRALS